MFRDETASEAFRCAVPAISGSWLAGPLPVKLAPGSEIAWDGRSWQVVNIGNDGAHLIDSDGQYAKIQVGIFEQLIRNGAITGLPEEVGIVARAVVEERMQSASHGDLAEAVKRFRALFSDTEIPAHHQFPPRTFRRYMRAYREAELGLGCGFVGLLPKISQRGNRLPKIDQAVFDVIEKLMEERYAQPIREKRHLTYGEFLLRCDEEGLAHACEKTFRKTLRRLRTHKLEAMRMGAKAAYVREEFYW